MSQSEEKKGYEQSPSTPKSSRQTGNWWEEVEYVIDEYWDEKFGFHFGILDWRALGLGC